MFIGESERKSCPFHPTPPCPWQSGNCVSPREVGAQPTILSTPFPIPMLHRDHVSLGRCGLSPPSTPSHSLSPCQAGDHVSLGRVQPTVLRKGEWDQPRLMAAALTLQYRENGVLRHSHHAPMYVRHVYGPVTLSTWLGPSAKTPGRHTQQPEGMLVSALVPADRWACKRCARTAEK